MGTGRSLKGYHHVTLVKKLSWRISVPPSPFAHCSHISVENNIPVPWQSSWKNTWHCNLLNFTTTSQNSNVLSNVKGRKRIMSSVFILWRNSKQGRKADFFGYQHFKILVGTYERAHLEKNKSTAQTAVGKVWKEMKADFSAAD